MRVPVRRMHGRASERQESPADALADILAKKYTVERKRQFSADGDGFIAEIALPQRSIIVEILEKRSDKAIMAEMRRERIARAAGWSICVLNPEDVRDADDVMRKISREIERR